MEILIVSLLLIYLASYVIILSCCGEQMLTYTDDKGNPKVDWVCLLTVFVSVPVVVFYYGLCLVEDMLSKD